MCTINQFLLCFVDSAVLRLTVHECQDLAGPAKINPYVRVIVNGEEKIKTSIAWHTHNPAYEKAGEVVVLDKSEVFVRVEVKDWNKVHKDELLGVWTCYLSEILEKQEENDGWWPLTLGDDNKTGKLRLSAQWRPVVMMGLLDSTTGHGYNGKYSFAYLAYESLSKYIFHNSSSHWRYAAHILGSP